MAATVGSRPDRLDDDRDGHKLSALVSSATKDVSSLLRDEVALAKAEVKRDVKRAATGSGLFAAAAVLAVFALIMLSFAAAYGIHALGLGLAWAWLIVAGGYLFIGAVCAGVGILRLKGIRGVNATKRSTNESLAVLKRTVR
ncbi:MAG: phage holin family protein [Actinocrinis sp.]